jgi:hypothetical protein
MVGHALDFEYISPERRQELEMDFNSSAVKPLISNEIKHKKWTCDMYGVRTRLQVQRDVKLYNWKDDNSWKNDGAQVIVSYTPEKDVLVGRTERFEDQVKLKADGRLISQLSLVKPNREVIAYSVCKSL